MAQNPWPFPERAPHENGPATAEPRRNGPDLRLLSGGLALHGAAVEVAPEEERQFVPLNVFLDSREQLSAAQQLELTGYVMEALGKKLPALSSQQLEALQRTAEAYPGWRIIPTPLLDGEGRQELMRTAALELFGQQVNPEAALRLPSWSSDYGKLLRDPGDTLQIGSGRRATVAVLRHKLTTDVQSGAELANRDDFVKTLLTDGRAVEDETGGVWVFPVVNVQPSRTEARTLGGSELYATALEPTLLPETALMIRLLHSRNGTLDDQSEVVDLTNEGVFTVGSVKKESMIWLRSVAGVRYDPDYDLLTLQEWSAASDTQFRLREAVSGLPAQS